jgi:hypothetical protein
MAEAASTPAGTTPPGAEHTGPRMQADLVYHAGLGQVVLLNGSRTDDRVWGWDGVQWQVLGAAGPSARELGGAVYDAERGRLVVYGGRDQRTGECMYDTWEWDGQAWEQFEDTHPDVCTHIVMEYAPWQGREVLFGGADHELALHSGMWTWDGQAWVWHDVQTPAHRFHALSAADPQHGQLFLLGGFDIGNQLFDEFWAWDGAVWEPLNLPGPPALSHGRMVFDSTRVQLVMFGGTTRARAPFALEARTWILTGGAWRAVETIGPSARGGHAMAYDPGRDRVVLYGGIDDASRRLYDTWEWNNRRWTCVDGCE